MSEYQTVEVPFKTIGNKQFLGLYDIKRLNLEDFVERFKHCFDFYEAACQGMCGAFYYPEGVPKEIKETL